jgi:hypothetical protein
MGFANRGTAMTRQFLLMLTVTSALAACAPKGAQGDVLSDTKVTTVARTVQCTEPNADGVRCDRKTCKKDAASDCGIFMDRCTQSGHSYEGNADSGTCIRGDQVG